MKYTTIILSLFLSTTSVAQKEYCNSQLGYFDSLKIAFIPTNNNGSNSAISNFLKQFCSTKFLIAETTTTQKHLDTNSQFRMLVEKVFLYEKNKNKLSHKDVLGGLTQDEVDLLRPMLGNANILLFVSNINYRSILKQSGKGKTRLSGKFEIYSLEYGVILSYKEVKINVPYIINSEDDEKITSLLLKEYENSFKGCLLCTIR